MKFGYMQQIGFVLILFVLWRSNGGVSAEITQVTYVHEKDQSGGVPPGVQFTQDELYDAGKISAAAIEDDTEDATGQTPPQYKIAVNAAKEAGLPSLVVQAGEKVVEVLADTKENPLTEEQVREATGQ